jgi:hypothetical protein
MQSTLGLFASLFLLFIADLPFPLFSFSSLSPSLLLFSPLSSPPPSPLFLIFVQVNEAADAETESLLESKPALFLQDFSNELFITRYNKTQYT